MSERQPDCDPGYELEQYDLRMKVIHDIQTKLRGAKLANDDYLALQRLHKASISSKYLIRAGGNEAVPAPHYRFVLEPRDHGSIQHGILAVRLEIPRIPAADIISGADEIITNDALITFAYENGTTIHRLLTPRGYITYTHPDQVVRDYMPDFSKDDMTGEMDTFGFELNGNLFTVQDGTYQTNPEMDMLQLQFDSDVIEKYHFAIQDNGSQLNIE